MDSCNGQAPTESSTKPTIHSTPVEEANRAQKRSRSNDDSRDMGTSHANKRTFKKQKNDNWKDRNGPAKKHGRQSQKSSSKGHNERKVAKYGRKKEDEESSSMKDAMPKSIYSVEFSKEEIAGEERRPKRKVAVMIGYCGSGYKGLQVMTTVKTIEGDLFGAFVAAGAISKANADEAKKVQLVRCARTDKGVHAAGNVLSLKLIIEDKDIVRKINEHLPPQIRVWGIEQTINSFSAYHQCDSRIYEYLIPTYCFLPPNPQTFLGKKLEELADEAGDIEQYRTRQLEVSDFWTEAEEKYVKPVLEVMDPTLREQAVHKVFTSGAIAFQDNEITTEQDNGIDKEQPISHDGETSDENRETIGKLSTHTPLELAIRSIKAAHQQARVAYRITPARLDRVKSTLGRYVGTWKYHNFTVQKRANDPSCKRHIKSFVVHGEPFLIGTTEWLSLKVHGQSFMMHQIRKMVLMAAMIVRCGTHEARIQDSFDAPRITIPRAPALGLLLERPIFEGYNKYGRHKGGGGGRKEIEFEKYQAEMDAFKQKQIYERMWKEEADQQVFANLFGGLDSLHSSQLLWASSLGMEALQKNIAGAVDLDHALGEEEQPDAGGEEG